MVFDKYKALQYILRVAYQKGISQSKLCENIYDVSHFNRMCNGKENVNLDVVMLCADKLSIEYNDLFSNSVVDKQKEINDYVNEFKRLSSINGTSELKNLYHEIEHYKYESKQIQQLKLVIHAYLEWRDFQHIMEAKKLLHKAFYTTAFKFDIIHGDYTVLSEMELEILIDISICEAKLGNLEISILYLDCIVKGLEHSPQVDLRIKCLMFLSAFSIENHNLEKALQSCELGINRSVHYNNYLHLCQLHYQKAIISYLLKDENFFIDELSMSYSLATTQNQLISWKQTFKKDIMKYQIPTEIIKDFTGYGDFANA